MTDDSCSVRLDSPFGLIAGSGRFPLEVARNARAQGVEVIAVAHKGETDPIIESLASHCTWVRVGELGKLLRAFSKKGVKQAAFAGAISRPKLFAGVKLDWQGLALIARARSVKDDAILRAVAEELERLGIKVVPGSMLLKESQPPAGLLTRRDFSPDEWRDALVGWDAAKTLGEADIGQTVVALEGVVVAVEAVEGTDATIKRAGELSRRAGKAGRPGVFSRGRRGLVVVKVCKPGQDQRIDLPTIGEKTLYVMQEAGAAALLLEAGKSIIIDPLTVVKKANQAGIAIRLAESRAEVVSAGKKTLAVG